METLTAFAQILNSIPEQPMSGVKTIGIREVQSLIYGSIDPYTSEGLDLLKVFLAQNNCSFYAAPKEDFSYISAIRKAMEEGNTTVIVENLS